MLYPGDFLERWHLCKGLPTRGFYQEQEKTCINPYYYVTANIWCWNDTFNWAEYQNKWLQCILAYKCLSSWNACCSHINFSLLWELSTHLAQHMPVSSSMKAFSLVMMMVQMICQRIHKEKTCSNARLPWKSVKCEPRSFLDAVTALVRATIRRQQLYLWRLWQMPSEFSSKKPSPQTPKQYQLYIADTFSACQGCLLKKT